jgi:hypothetical protein
MPHGEHGGASWSILVPPVAVRCHRCRVVVPWRDLHLHCECGSGTHEWRLTRYKGEDGSSVDPPSPRPVSVACSVLPLSQRLNNVPGDRRQSCE